MAKGVQEEMREALEAAKIEGKKLESAEKEIRSLKGMIVELQTENNGFKLVIGEMLEEVDVSEGVMIRKAGRQDAPAQRQQHVS